MGLARKRCPHIPAADTRNALAARAGMNVRPTSHAAIARLDAPASASELTSGRITSLPRLRVEGKFVFAGEQKFWIRGVTYGTFKPDSDGAQFPPPENVERDFRAMARAGLNAVRTYTSPPSWMMDLAAECGRSEERRVG